MNNCERLIELIVLKLNQDWFPLLELLAMVFCPSNKCVHLFGRVNHRLIFLFLSDFTLLRALELNRLNARQKRKYLLKVQTRERPEDGS